MTLIFNWSRTPFVVDTREFSNTPENVVVLKKEQEMIMSRKTSTHFWLARFYSFVICC